MPIVTAMLQRGAALVLVLALQACALQDSRHLIRLVLSPHGLQEKPPGLGL